MSTKIYNGFRMRELSSNELIVFINELREKISPTVHNAFCIGIIQIASKIITKCIEYNFDFEGTPEKAENVEKFLRSYYLASLTTTTMAQRALGKMDKVIDDLEWPFIGGVINMAINIYKNDTMNENKQSCYNDVRSSIALLQGSKGKTLFMTFGNVFTDCMYELIKKNDELVSKYEIEEYGYWNNTDKPDGITNEEWKNCGDDWDAALPGLGVPSRCGLCSSDLIDPDVLFSEVKMAEDGRMRKIINDFSLLKYIHALVCDKTISHFVKMDSEYDEKLSSTYALVVKYREKIEKDDPQMKDYADKLENEMIEQLSDRSIEEILSGSILELLPKYTSYKKMRNEGGNDYDNQVSS